MSSEYWKLSPCPLPTVCSNWLSLLCFKYFCRGSEEGHVKSWFIHNWVGEKTMNNKTDRLRVAPPWSYTEEIIDIGQTKGEIVEFSCHRFSMSVFVPHTEVCVWREFFVDRLCYPCFALNPSKATPCGWRLDIGAGTFFLLRHDPHILSNCLYKN